MINWEIVFSVVVGIALFFGLLSIAPYIGWIVLLIVLLVVTMFIALWLCNSPLLTSIALVFAFIMIFMMCIVSIKSVKIAKNDKTFKSNFWACFFIVFTLGLALSMFINWQGILTAFLSATSSFLCYKYPNHKIPKYIFKKLMIET